MSDADECIADLFYKFCNNGNEHTVLDLCKDGKICDMSYRDSINCGSVYRCSKCGGEAILRWNRAELNYCPCCGAKVLNIFAISSVNAALNELEGEELAGDYWQCGYTRCDECTIKDGKSPKDYYSVESCETAQCVDIVERMKKLYTGKKG